MQPKPAEEKETDGVRYRVRYLTTTKNQRLLADLFKIVAPSFATLVNPSAAKDLKDTAQIGALLSKLGPETLRLATTELALRLDNEKVASMLKDLASCTSFSVASESGDEKWLELGPQYDLHFQGRMKAWREWVVFALEVQLGDFFA